MANVTLQIDADAAKAIRELVKMVQAQDKSTEATKRSAGAFRKQKQEMTAVESAGAKITSGLAGLAAGVFSISKINEAWQSVLATLDNIGTTQERIGKEAIALAVVLKGSKNLDAEIGAAMLQGAKHGFMPGESALTMQRAISVFGKEGGADAAEAAFQMAEVTGDLETARENLKIARALGMTPREFTSSVVGAAATSAADEAVMLGASYTLPMFSFGGKKEPGTGFAAMNALSQVWKNEELATYMKAAANALTSESDLTKKIKGFDEMTGEDRLKAMRAELISTYGNTSSEALQKAGISEIRQKGALSTIFDEAYWEPQFLKTIKEAPSYPQGFDPDELIKNLTGKEGSQLLLQNKQAEQVRALNEVEKLFGPESEVARQRQIGKNISGAEYGTRFGVDPETGKAGFTRRLVDTFLKSGSGASISTEPTTPPTTDLLQEELADAINKQTERLEKAITGEKKEVRNRNANNEP